MCIQRREAGVFQSLGSDSATIQDMNNLCPHPRIPGAAGAGTAPLFMLRGTLSSCHAAPDATDALCFLDDALEGQAAFEADQG